MPQHLADLRVHLFCAFTHYDYGSGAVCHAYVAHLSNIAHGPLQPIHEILKFNARFEFVFDRRAMNSQYDGLVIVWKRGEGMSLFIKRYVNHVDHECDRATKPDKRQDYHASPSPQRDAAWSGRFRSQHCPPPWTATARAKHDR